MEGGDMQGGMGARPQWVTILAAVSIVGGIFLLLGGLAAFGIGTIFGAAGVKGGILVTLAGLLAIVAGALDIAFGYGAWTQQPWAWRLGVFGAVLGVVGQLLFVVAGAADFTSLIGSLVVAAVLLYFLNMPAVRRGLGGPDTGWPLMGGRM
jgi:hypothetical protein